MILTRLRQIFNRYAAAHLSIKKRGFPLLDEHKAVIGHLETVRLQHNRLSVEGWSCADRISLELNGVRVDLEPHAPRADAEAVHGARLGRLTGFQIDLPFESGPYALRLDRGGQVFEYQKAGFGKSRVSLSKALLLFRFFRDGLRALPYSIKAMQGGDLAARQKIKTLLGLELASSAMDLDADLYPEQKTDAPLASQSVRGDITIILPVYNAFDLLPEVLVRVEQNTDLPWHLVLIEDCSTDSQVRPFLRQWVQSRDGVTQARIHLLENEENLGFIRSVNRAFEVARELGHHVILLNSDAFVPKNWASRLMQPIFEQVDVATVTPMSNDAEIFTVPVICQRNDLVPGAADRIDAVARGLAPAACRAPAPTGVGFCMAVNLKYLKAEPAFDTAFGRGYGEEVDWCQRVAKHGGQHLGIANLFVEHRGGSSFGSTAKMQMVLANNAIVSGRYPDYDARVQSFIQQDPLSSGRLALALAWAATQAGEAAVPLYLGHSMGGGAEDYLQARIRGDLAADPGVAVVLRVGGKRRWSIELHCSMGVISGRCDEISLVQNLLAPFARRKIVYSCAVGDRDPVEIPAVLLGLKQAQDRLEILFHDFFPLSPSYTLLDADGSFRGVPQLGTADSAHDTRRWDGSILSFADWQVAWNPLIMAADELTVFSDNSRQIVQTACAENAASVVVRPHQLLFQPDPVNPRAAKGKPVIGVLGNIGYQKGAEVLAKLSLHLARTGEAELVVIGNVDPRYPLVAPARIHGTYKPCDISALTEQYGIDFWLIPSIWPETFSYATHEALATGVPVWCFDIGAQADAVRQAEGAGGVIPLKAGTDPLPALLEAILKSYKNKEVLA